jgi:hypothetical protein
LPEENSALVKYALDGYSAVEHRIDAIETSLKGV